MTARRPWAGSFTSVFGCLLLACCAGRPALRPIALEPPQLSASKDELLARVQALAEAAPAWTSDGQIDSRILVTHNRHGVNLRMSCAKPGLLRMQATRALLPTLFVLVANPQGVWLDVPSRHKTYLRPAGARPAGSEGGHRQGNAGLRARAVPARAGARRTRRGRAVGARPAASPLRAVRLPAERPRLATHAPPLLRSDRPGAERARALRRGRKACQPLAVRSARGRRGAAFRAAHRATLRARDDPPRPHARQDRARAFATGTFAFVVPGGHEIVDVSLARSLPGELSGGASESGGEASR